MNVWHAQNALNHVSNDWFYHYVRAGECVFFKIQKKIFDIVCLFLNLIWNWCGYVCLFVWCYMFLWMHLSVCALIYTHHAHAGNCANKYVLMVRKKMKIVLYYLWNGIDDESWKYVSSKSNSAKECP